MKMRSLSLAVLMLLLLTVLAGCAGTQRLTVGGPSMLPTLADGAKVAVDKKAYAQAGPQRGDIIAFNSTKGQIMIKRVVALPGETIEIKDGKVFINGAELQEAYLNEQGSTEAGDAAKWDVPDRCVFVLGDNRTSSTDSRGFGPVSYDSIVGRIMQ